MWAFSHYLLNISCEESNTTEWLHFHFSLSCIGEGNGNPLQCSYLENPRDRGAWWAAVYGAAQSWTRLKWLSSSSSSQSLLLIPPETTIHPCSVLTLYLRQQTRETEVALPREREGGRAPPPRHAHFRSAIRSIHRERGRTRSCSPMDGGRPHALNTQLWLPHRITKISVIL